MKHFELNFYKHLLDVYYGTEWALRWTGPTGLVDDEIYRLAAAAVIAEKNGFPPPYCGIPEQILVDIRNGDTTALFAYFLNLEAAGVDTGDTSTSR